MSTGAATPEQQVPSSAREVVGDAARLIGGFVREQPVVFTLAAVGAVLFTSAIVASAVVVGWVTDEVIVPVLTDGAPTAGRLGAALALILGVAVWKSVGIVVRRTAASRMQFGAQTRLRKRLIAHQLGLSLRWFGTRGVGDLLSVSDVDSRQATMMLAPLPFATGVTFLLVGSAAVITVTDPYLGGLAVVLLAVVVGLDLRGAWLTFHLMEEAQRRRGAVAGVAHESFDGALTVKALGREQVETERFGRVADSLADQLVEVGRVWTGYRALTEGLPAVGTIVVLVVGTARIAGDALTTGELVRVTYLLSLLAVPTRLIGYLMWDAAHSVAGWRRVETVLRADDVLTHGDDRTPPPSPAARLEADRVAFGYEPGVRVLHDLELHLEPGRTLAVVGPTGSGKSTLALLLARLWDPDHGTVRLDGRDLRRLAPGVLPGEVAYVAQDAFLFDETVAGNVALHLDADEDRIREALRMANALGFVDDLPAGLHTRLGERGTTLSGGQRQRIALARALVRRPRLLVLDDATSAVDPSVETAILRALREADLPSTIVMIAYRRSSIMLADDVVFVDDGRVVAHGPHEDLLRTVPGYAALLRAYETEHPT
ncbi:ABC transporter ATP-binding protein [Egicoccus sp. AB-alg2]|uniref:ABC transporter ATP-binding protein n=1 Tax=Egicoccus sp. AB-alg2 TaxID=3242693 RepID=UPI00359D9B4B